MKFMTAILLMSSAALASATPQSLVGTYSGVSARGDCTLSIDANLDFRVDYKDGDSVFVWHAGNAVRAELAKGANPLRFKNVRTTLGGADGSYVLALDAVTGKPVSIQGTQSSWGFSQDFDCTLTD